MNRNAGPLVFLLGVLVGTLLGGGLHVSVTKNIGVENKDGEVSENES
jgi:hypothetical protein